MGWASHTWGKTMAQGHSADVALTRQQEVPGQRDLRCMVLILQLCVVPAVWEVVSQRMPFSGMHHGKVAAADLSCTTPCNWRPLPRMPPSLTC